VSKKKKAFNNEKYNRVVFLGLFCVSILQTLFLDSVSSFAEVVVKDILLLKKKKRRKKNSMSALWLAFQRRICTLDG
jgi:hypothetical protein